MKLPEHIAIIMDGNGRWAKERGFSRIRGHEAGAKIVREIVQECARLHIKYLTLYAFSSENWKRPFYETTFLMKLLKKYLVKERPDLMKNNIKLTAIGRTDDLPRSAQKVLARTIEMTEHNTGLTLCLALNYGGRIEIIDAARKICRAAKEGKINPDQINETIFRQYLYAPDIPEPDMLIRTGGEMRLSNFLLWQIAYTELWVTPVLWPDFSKKLLRKAIKDFSTRHRRFGGI